MLGGREGWETRQKRGPYHLPGARPLRPAVTPSTVAETTPRLRDCREAVRELRASERVICGLHRLDRTLHAFWAKLPLRRLRILATSALVVGVGYLVLSRRQTIAHFLAG